MRGFLMEDAPGIEAMAKVGCTQWHCVGIFVLIRGIINMGGDSLPLGMLMLQSDHRQLVHVDQNVEEDAGDEGRDEALRVAERTLLVARSYPDKLQLMRANRGVCSASGRPRITGATARLAG
ncbi:TPA: hypothetical protein ACSP88_002418 [Aeromonas hydrophila]